MKIFDFIKFKKMRSGIIVVLICLFDDIFLFLKQSTYKQGSLEL